MKISILCVGKLKNRYPLHPLVSFYKERIKTRISIVEISPQDPEHLEKSSYIWEQNIHPMSRVWALEKSGVFMDEYQWATTIRDEYQAHKAKDIQILIGGSKGIPQKILSASHRVISLGSITWNHQLARILLLDLIYRCEKIWGNHPYART